MSVIKCIPNFWQRRNAEVVDLQHASLCYVPDQVLACGKQLQELYLDANQLSELPKVIHVFLILVQIWWYVSTALIRELLFVFLTNVCRYFYRCFISNIHSPVCRHIHFSIYSWNVSRTSWFWLAFILIEATHYF